MMMSKSLLALAVLSTCLLQMIESGVASNCNPKYPFMSVGDYNITKDNFKK